MSLWLLLGLCRQEVESTLKTQLVVRNLASLVLGSNHLLLGDVWDWFSGAKHLAKACDWMPAPRPRPLAFAHPDRNTLGASRMVDTT